MCTFRITNYETDPEGELNRRLKPGGPDLSNTIELNGLYFTHHLLSITGEFTPQPIIKDNYLFMLMGEIYNYDKSLPSDIYFVIDEYLKYGNDFIHHMDGEFLIIIYDIEQNLINIFTDIWRTKQVYLRKNEDYFSISTLDIKNITLKHNSHYTFDPIKLKLEHVNDSVHNFNLDQFKTNLDDAISSLENAVLKRYQPNSTLLLSGGVDSIAAAICLTKHKKHFNSITLTHTANEDPISLRQILRYSRKYNNSHIIDYYCNDYHKEVERIQKELFNSRVFLSGTGPAEQENYLDKQPVWPKGRQELASKYDNYAAPNLKFTSWPEDLSSIFPWQHFYEGMNKRITNKQETIAIDRSLESRGIYRDKYYAQEWLNLTSDIKNLEYKVIQKTYIRNHGLTPTETIAGAPFGPYMDPYTQKIIHDNDWWDPL
jgi:hypothetical protein